MANEQNLKKFTSEYQPEGRGRKPSILKQYIKENKISSADVSLLIKSILFESTEKEMVEMLADKNKPIIIRLFVRAFMEDFRKGRLENIEKLLDRAIGKNKAEIDLRAVGEINVNRDEKKINERLEELLRKYKEGSK